MHGCVRRSRAASADVQVSQRAQPGAAVQRGTPDRAERTTGPNERGPNAKPISP